MDSARPDRDALEAEIAELRARLKAQGDELEGLRKQLAPATAPTRRDLLRAGGLVGAGLAALTVAGVAGATPQPAAAIEGHNLRLRGGILIYLTLKGQKQGTIQGSVTQKGREGSIACQYLQQKIIVPFDAASGLPTGRRVHEALVFRKTVDRSTPMLLSALVNNENITEAHFKFWRTSTLGAEEQYFTIDLQNAMLASHDFYHPDSQDSTAPIAGSGGSGSSAGDLEEMTLTYQRITWTYTNGGITAQDDWEIPI